MDRHGHISAPLCEKYNAGHWAFSTNKPCWMNTRWADNQFNHVLIICMAHESCLTEWKNTMATQQHYNALLHSFEPRLGFWAARLNSGSTKQGFWTFHGERVECHYIGTTMKWLWRHSRMVQCCCSVKLQTWSASETYSHTVCSVIPEPFLVLCTTWRSCISG
jgi:hypothetical protein